MLCILEKIVQGNGTSFCLVFNAFDSGETGRKRDEANNLSAAINEAGNNEVKEEKTKTAEAYVSARDLGDVKQTKDGKEENAESPAGTNTETSANAYTSINTHNTHYFLGEEQFLAEQFYKAPALDYQELFNGQAKEKPTLRAEEYSAEALNVETKREMLTTEEAEETFERIQYSSLLGTASDVSAEERRKFDWWIKFNPSYFAVFLANSLTRDVNYGSL